MRELTNAKMNGKAGSQHPTRTAALASRKRTESPPVMRPQPWTISATGAVVPLGMALTAAYTSAYTKFERTSLAAWIAVAIVGTASVIATSAATRRIYEAG